MFNKQAYYWVLHIKEDGFYGKAKAGFEMTKGRFDTE